MFEAGSVIAYGGRVTEVRKQNFTLWISSSARILLKFQLNKFEVLIGDPHGVKWVFYSFRLNVQELGATPVEGGKDGYGRLLYAARVKHNGGMHTAIVGEHLHAAHLAFNGTEVFIDVRTRLMSWSASSVFDLLVVGVRSVVPRPVSWSATGQEK